MSAWIVTWRIKFFEPDGDAWLKTIYLGPAEVGEVKAIVCPDDNQEMCGSYPLSKQMIEWLAVRFNRSEIIDSGYDLFLERET